MHLLIDMGNTRTKWTILTDQWDTHSAGLYEGQWAAVPHIDQCTHALLCQTGHRPDELLQLHQLDITTTTVAEAFFNLQDNHAATHNDSLPRINYHDAAHTLGHDRIAALCGAWAIAGEDCLVIDAGTCITIDYLDSTGAFNGGAILPSPELQLLAMHQHTARLPQVEIDYQKVYTSLAGHDTASSMLAGTVAATAAAINSFIVHYSRRHHGTTPFQTIITGGIGQFLNTMISGAHYVDNLVFDGMKTIAMNCEL